MNQDSKPFWKQPLFHFLLIGAAIFALNAMRDKPEDPASHTIVITVPQVERMAALWQKTWGRPPSESELQGLVRDHIKEEIYVREAMTLGLDNNDTVIRRRLRQKMEFLTTGEAAAVPPSDADLQNYYTQNAAKYRRGPVFSFDQVYFTTAHKDQAEQALAALKAGQTVSGDPISLPENLTQADKADIARVFGSKFYKGLLDQPIGVWVGPITSGFGEHVVKIEQKIPGQLPEFEKMRKRVLADYQAQAEREARDEAYREMRKKYDVDIETP